MGCPRLACGVQGIDEGVTLIGSLRSILRSDIVSGRGDNGQHRDQALACEETRKVQMPQNRPNGRRTVYDPTHDANDAYHRDHRCGECGEVEADEAFTPDTERRSSNAPRLLGRTR